MKRRSTQISKPGKHLVERVAADANGLLSAVAGRAALKVFSRTSTEVLVPQYVVEEVEEYIPKMAEQYGLAPEALEANFKLLRIKRVPKSAYKSMISRAKRLLEDRDSDDVDLLALAMKEKTPIWSNDKDFEDTGVEVLPTAKLLKILGL